MEYRLFIVFFLILLSVCSISAYTEDTGIERDDVVKLDYVLSYDGAEQQISEGFETKVNDEVLIVGFYEGLLGMKIGEEKEIVVPPEKGYADGPLKETILYFDVHILEIIENVRGNDFEDGPTLSLDFPSLQIFTIAIGLLVLQKRQKA
ncbi:MAG: FKBP-type peptidyl-prolyl cis-trans isomerase [Candidatus Heimdallarchaeota archaeon]|nr:FKBP-type peptidyl-prolyl cis-trans isomerase [Candidatus Heimdallarchaeota archaeon]